MEVGQLLENINRISLPPTPRMRRKSVKQTLEQSGSSRISRVTEHIRTRLQQSIPQWKQLLILITLVIVNVRISRLFMPATDGVSRPCGTCIMPAEKRDTGDENAHYSRCINRSTAPVPSRNSDDKYLHCISGCD